MKRHQNLIYSKMALQLFGGSVFAFIADEIWFAQDYCIIRAFSLKLNIADDCGSVYARDFLWLCKWSYGQSIVHWASLHLKNSKHYPSDRNINGQDERERVKKKPLKQFGMSVRYKRTFLKIQSFARLRRDEWIKHFSPTSNSDFTPIYYYRVVKCWCCSLA